MDIKGRSFTKLLDFTSEEIMEFIELAQKLKEEKKQGVSHRELMGKNVVLLFQKDSTRTRAAFEVAAMDLGMGVTYFGEQGSQMGKKESVADTARVLGRMYDGIEFRGYKQSDVETLAMFSGVPVWNGLTNEYHPTQVLADFLTIYEKKDRLQGIKFTYVGDGRNNVANSLMIGAAKMGMDFIVLGPRELWPSQELIEQARELAKQSGGTLKFTEDVMEGTYDVDVIYTDVWVSMGEPASEWEKRVKMLEAYQVDMDMLKNADEEVLFMHCLPAFHDLNTVVGKEIAEKLGKKYKSVALGQMEVTDEVFDSVNSVVFDEAENRLHTIKAVMLATMK